MKLNTIILAVATVIGAVSAKNHFKCTEEKDPGLFECRQMGIMDANRPRHRLGWPDQREDLHAKNDKKCIDECYSRYTGDVVTFLGQCQSFAWSPEKKGDAVNCVMFNETLDGLMGVHPPGKYVNADAFNGDWDDWVYNNMRCWKCRK